MSNSSSDNKPKQYTAQSIRVMEGLEAVRKRPSMYIGSTNSYGLHHIVYEVVDNSVDESLAGNCNKIKIILHEDNSCSVEDNGRGIPVDIHPGEGISAAEVVLTKLHAGGKFDKDSYKFSGGLHGVGISVVNALSESLDLTIFKNGNIYEQNYKAGKPTESLIITGKTNKQGTLVRFQPDPKIFTETVDLSFDKLSTRFRELAFLNKGLNIIIIDKRHAKKESFLFEGGIVSFIEYINAKKTTLFSDILYLNREDERYILECALQYNDGYGEQLLSFVNNINTIDGGTHITGFKAALTKACNKRAQEMKFLKDGTSFSSDDVREGLVCVISIKIPEPQFEGQTKTKLGNSEIKGLVSSWMFTFLDTYFEENPAIAKKIFQKAELSMRARAAAKKAREITRRKNVLESTILPGKLADCSKQEPSECELFIVEGDSAGGSAKMGRDRFTQAILPLRGKILNVEKARLDRALSNEEIKALISAIGCGIGKDEFDPKKARYHKIILMTDADVDGSHIRTLLLTFFFRYMRPLIEHGYLYVAQPPLYKAKIGKKEQYFKDESEFKRFLVNWALEHTKLVINGKNIDAITLSTLFIGSTNYEKQLYIVSNTLNIPYIECDAIATALCICPFKVDQNINLLIDELNKVLPKFTIYHEISTVEDVIIENESNNVPTNESSIEKTTNEKAAEEFIIFKHRHGSWKVNLEALDSQEMLKLILLRKSLSELNQTWILKIINKERSVEGNGILNILKALTTISKPYLNIQRYKGLGEMNPEQLWETAMDPEQRLLLQITIDDALKADEWFSTLMGDDVAGRRAFIIESGHFVKNIDV